MNDLKQIMYGVTDFVLMRRENAYFVDCTGLICELEKTSNAQFLRPRWFGKSLLCAILQAYYESDYATQFAELFGGLGIGRNPTRPARSRATRASTTSRAGGTCASRAARSSCIASSSSSTAAMSRSARRSQELHKMFVFR